MNGHEKFELQRQGAKAAARDDGAESNPLLRKLNMPVATGESEPDWNSRRDAWRDGYDIERRAQRRTPRSNLR